MIKKGLFILPVLFAIVFFSLFVYQTGIADVRYSVSIDVPGLIIIPGTYVYYESENNNDMYFYDGFWWRPWHNGWQRADRYSGPWIIIDLFQVPQPVTHLPNGWRNRINRNDRIPWNDVNSHWRQWKNDKYWDKHNWKRDNIKTQDNNQRMNDNNRKPVVQQNNNRPDNTPRVNNNNRKPVVQQNNSSKPDNNQRIRNNNQKKTVVQKNNGGKKDQPQQDNGKKNNDNAQRNKRDK